jgi:small subunit ribosomal protein S13
MANVFLLGRNFEGDTAVCLALRKIYGVGKKRSMDVCEETSVSPWAPLGSLSKNQLRDIATLIRGKYTIDLDLKREVYGAVRREMDLRSYRGLRHRYGLPVRGQRTRSNGRTGKALLRK